MMIIVVDYNTEYSSELIGWLRERGIGFEFGFRDAAPPAPPSPPEGGGVRMATLSEILESATLCFGVTVEDMVGRSKREDVLFARHAFCLAARMLTPATVVAIGTVLNRDHATVLHSCKVADALIETGYGDFKSRFEKLKSMLL